MTERLPAADLAEQEVDLASAWQRLTVRWWLPVGGLLVGAVLGLIVALASGTVWTAATIIYLGQPFASGAQIQSLATNPRTVAEIVRSEAVLRDVSRRSGIPVSKLRASVSTRELTWKGQARGVNPLVEIAVKGTQPRRLEQAADALAARVVEDVSAFVLEKVRLLNEQVARNEAQLEEVQDRILLAREQQQEILANRSLPLDERLLLLTNLNSVLTTADQRRAAIQDQLFSARQLLNQATNVEASRVVERAVAARSSARSSRTSLLVGALIGLLVGAVAALAVEPVVARRRVAMTGR
jgi:gas vesicle protein